MAAPNGLADAALLLLLLALLKEKPEAVVVVPPPKPVGLPNKPPDVWVVPNAGAVLPKAPTTVKFS